ncbi:MAG: CRISPR-associated protein Cas5 [Anaerolineales bacterium]|nr:CRISPR-associated protein Cas5 [Anaerolineales bacterium]MDW8446846.1 CRISPR-associated protein Cas5 [Anaerolineales bacterium]
MRVLKVVAEGITTSFRYPHFMYQIHPTYEMPPPATIYGHIASALGEWFDPREVRFAYHFSYAAKADDLEHIILLGPPEGSLPGFSHPRVLEGNVNPFRRTLLFQPRLVLYLDRSDWIDAFRSPKYAVVLGRSQDLFTYSAVSIIELQESDHAYLEHTLLPYSANRFTNRGYAVLMPRWIDYAHGRRPTFERYFIVHERIYCPEELLLFDQDRAPRFWVDPQSPEVRGRHLGLVFHSFVGDDQASTSLS